MLLQQFGWTEHFEQNFHAYKTSDLLPGRISGIHGLIHTVVGIHGTTACVLAGSLLHSKENTDLPRVGDWVVIKLYDDQGIIVDVLPRRNVLARKLPGKTSARQVLAANVDTAFIIQGLDRDFNIMCLQRYVSQVSQCGISPVVVLNKKDLPDDPDHFLREVTGLGYRFPVVMTSALNNKDVLELTAAYLHPWKTHILIGSSGAGKSTLLNAMLGSKIQEEGLVSNSTSKGRHTTTARDLFILSNGSLIIDTPGMREFGMTLENDDAGLVSHPLIDQLSGFCRFRNCTHAHEPGCAVIQAMENGELPAAVYRSYQKLVREQYHFQASLIEKKRVERQFGKVAKQVMSHRKRWKY